jgi:uncharacterized membrane protein YdjX (TVP38/TMEM64 family)
MSARALARVALVVLVVAVLAVAGRRAGALVPEFVRWVNGLGPWGPIAFVGGYIVASVALIPAALLTLAAGATFGVVRGVAVAFVGASLGASAAFLIARYAARGAVERGIAGNERFGAIDRAIGREGRKIVLLLRLSPVFPFNLLNYALGLTRVRFTDYVLAMPGMLPGGILYVYTGKLAGEVAALAGGAAPARSAGYYVVLGLGLAATAGVTMIITRAARRALAEVTAAPAPCGSGS